MAAPAGVIVPAQNPTPSFIDRVTAHPGLSIVVALLIAVVLGYIYSKIRGTNTQQKAGNEPGTAQGLPQTDASGNPVYYVPTSNTFVQGDLNQSAGNQTINQTNDFDTVTPGSPHPNPPPGGRGIFHVRKRFGQNETPQAQAWDKKHPQGVALFDKPGGKQVGLAPFDSSISIVGDPIYTKTTALDRLFPGNKDQGSDIWYKTSNGNYVSQFDVVSQGGLPPPAQNSLGPNTSGVGTPTGWQSA